MENMEKLKEFIEERVESAEMFANNYQEVMNCRAISFGALRFAEHIGLVSYEESKEYWEYIWNKFEQIGRNKKNEPKVKVI
jgi:hypothetical protein